MRSEKLIRLNTDEPARQCGNAAERQEIANQVEAFLADGGKIQKIPSSIGVQPAYGFGRAPAYRMDLNTAPQAPNGRS